MVTITINTQASEWCKMGETARGQELYKILLALAATASVRGHIDGYIIRDQSGMQLGVVVDDKE